MAPSPSLAERIEALSMPEPNSGCFLWTGALRRGGYGQIYINGKVRAAHRVAYELACGPVPPDLQLDHKCRVRSCVNPGHLEPVTSRENVLRGVGPTAQNAVKTHCPKGHPYDGENIYRLPNERRCRACATIHKRTWRRKRRAATSAKAEGR